MYLDIYYNYLENLHNIDTHTHGRMNYKDTEPYISAFLSNWPVDGLCDIVFNRFYRLEIQSLMDGIFDPACELLPP